MRIVSNSTSIFKGAFLAYAFALSWGSALINIFLLLIFLTWTFLLAKRKVSINKKDIFLWAVLSGFFVLNAFTILYSENVSFGLKKASLQSSIIILTFVVLSTRTIFDYRFTKSIVQSLTLGLLLNLVLSFAYQIIRFLSKEGRWVDYFIEDELSTAIVDNYFLGLSLLVSFAIIFNLKLFALKNHQNNFYEKYNYLIVAVLFGFLLLLNSRALIVITAILGTYIISSYFYKKDSKKNILYVIGAVILIIGTNYKFNRVFSEKVNEAINFDNRYDVNEYWGGRGMRLLIWDCAYKVIKANQLMGVGIGDQQDELTLCYKIYMMDQLLYNKQIRFNAHNIFLQAGLSSGVTGLFVFLLGILLSIKISYRYSNLFLFYSLIFMLSGLFESYLERNLTVAFYALFNPVIFAMALSEKNEDTPGT